MTVLKLPTDTIIIVPNSIKSKIIKKITNQELKNTKVLTLTELRKKFYFDYNNQAIYYLMKKYNYQYDVAKMYLSRFYEVDTNDFGSNKIKKVIELKEELEKERLLIYHPTFKSYLKQKNIIFLNVEPLDKFDEKMINDIKKTCQVELITEEKESYKHECIWEFTTIEEEVLYVASRIKQLVQSGVSFNQIKLSNVNGEYQNLIKRIFEWYHIPITLTDNYLYATKIGQDFLKNLDIDIEKTFKLLEEHYSLTNDYNLELYNKIIQIINNYNWAETILDVKSFLIEDFKNTTIGVTHYQEEVEIIDKLTQVTEDDYVFLLGFNQGEFPKTYKDESYFNDRLKEKLGLETTTEKNQRVYQEALSEIIHTKNLIITTKLTSSSGEHYLSSLNDDLSLEVKRGIIEYTDSHLYNLLTLGKKIDNLVKYNEKAEDLDLLYSNYPDISYKTFNSDYQQIPPTKIKNFLNNRLTLSYSAMNTYYQCSFRYYLSNILKLNIFEETFYTILGNLFHYILSIAFKEEIDLKKEYKEYLSKCTYNFNSREHFFLKRLEQELEFIINTIKKQNEATSLTKTFYEEKITIDKSRQDTEITFKGFVDKMMTNEQENIISIIDYKTGNPDLNLNHIIHGLDLQLPVYIYLAKNKFPSSEIAGFYLQKILNNEISKDYKHTYESLKEDKLKLQGYSNSNISILEQFDSSYYESKMIKGMRTTSKGLASKKVLNNEQITTLEQITEEKIEEAIEGILNASFNINPKRVGMDNLGCKYCSFKDICFFTEKNIVNLKEYKNMEFLGGDLDDTKETE